MTNFTNDRVIYTSTCTWIQSSNHKLHDNYYEIAKMLGNNEVNTLNNPVNTLCMKIAVWEALLTLRLVTSHALRRITIKC